MQIIIMRNRFDRFEPAMTTAQISLRKLARAANAEQTVLRKCHSTNGNAKLTIAPYDQCYTMPYIRQTMTTTQKRLNYELLGYIIVWNGA